MFADILVVPHALGQPVGFREGEGPVLDPVRSDTVGGLEVARVAERSAPVMETLRRVKAALPKDVTLIGFAGAPWTVATYMVEGGTSRDFARTKRWAFADPVAFGGLIDKLVDSTTIYLAAQIEAGAEVVQLFDSWAGVLPETEFRRWVIEPTKRITRAVKSRHPAVPIIGFPRGAGAHYATYVDETGVDAVSLDSAVPLGWASERLQARLPVQGNLDPIALVVGGDAMAAATQRIRSAFQDGPFVFNLGHGILPETPPENVAALVNAIRGDRGSS